MITADLVVFKGLLKSAGQNEQFDLLKYTTESEQALLGTVDIGNFDPRKGIASHKERLASIHYSWFVHLFSSVDHADQAWLLAALPEESQEQVLENLSIAKRKPSSFGATYLSEILYDIVIHETPNLIPLECLPPEPLIGLLDFSLPQLIELIDYLGLHDISPEIQTLINGHVLQKIHDVFSSKKKEYLKLLLGTKEPVIFTALNLNNWDGDEKKLTSVLHQRGLNRLAKTLFGKSPSYLWHLLHRFDLGRARALKAYLNDLNNKAAHDILNSQMEILLNFMTTKENL
jgi:hypothetical protein